MSVTFDWVNIALTGQTMAIVNNWLPTDADFYNSSSCFHFSAHPPVLSFRLSPSSTLLCSFSPPSFVMNTCLSFTTKPVSNYLSLWLSLSFLSLSSTSCISQKNGFYFFTFFYYSCSRLSSPASVLPAPWPGHKGGSVFSFRPAAAPCWAYMWPDFPQELDPEGKNPTLVYLFDGENFII